MLDKVNAYFKGLFKIPGLLRIKQNITFAPGFCSITILPQEVIIAYVLTIEGKPELQFCESFPYEKLSLLKSVITNAVKNKQLEGVHCSWILRNNNYQLILTEALPVTPSEFQAAIRWKIQDSLSFPIEDALIEYFSLPNQKAAGPSKMIMVVAARLSYITPFVNLIQETGLRLNTIDIPELALRNITALYEHDEKTSALIYLQETYVDLIITQQRQLFFSRRLDFDLKKIDSIVEKEEEVNKRLDKLSLDIQRSFDYYQSQWRNPAPSRVLLSSVKFSPEKIANYLSERLSINLQALDIKNIISCKQNISLEDQGKYLPSIGGVLREVVEHADSAN